MIRKVIIIFLVVATLGTATVWVAGLFGPQSNEWDLTDPMTDHVWGYVVSMNGSCLATVANFPVRADDHAYPQLRRRELLEKKRTLRNYTLSANLPTTLGFCWLIPWTGSGISVVIFPFWAPCILFAAYPTIAFIRGPVRRWRRRRNGWCLACGYDLQGNVSGVCPECGVLKTPRSNAGP